MGKDGPKPWAGKSHNPSSKKNRKGEVILILAISSHNLHLLAHWDTGTAQYAHALNPCLNVFG